VVVTNTTSLLAEHDPEGALLNVRDGFVVAAAVESSTAPAMDVCPLDCFCA
jgi:hypothetical protein